MNHYDAIIIGSGGSVTGRKLSEAGFRVLLLERGGPVPREDGNWSVDSVFFKKKYKAKDTWLDGTGQPFDPGMYYNVGGARKFFGGTMIRFRKRDFEAVEHKHGIPTGSFSSNSQSSAFTFSTFSWSTALRTMT